MQKVNTMSRTRRLEAILYGIFTLAGCDESGPITLEAPQAQQQAQEPPQRERNPLEREWGHPVQEAPPPGHADPEQEESHLERETRRLFSIDGFVPERFSKLNIGQEIMEVDNFFKRFKTPPGNEAGSFILSPFFEYGLYHEVSDFFNLPSDSRSIKPQLVVRYAADEGGSMQSLTFEAFTGFVVVQDLANSLSTTHLGEPFELVPDRATWYMGSLMIEIQKGGKKNHFGEQYDTFTYTIKKGQKPAEEATRESPFTLEELLKEAPFALVDKPAGNQEQWVAYHIE